MAKYKQKTYLKSMERSRPMNLKPFVIGYWCRVHGLTRQDLYEQEPFGKLTDEWSDEEDHQFDNGFEQADEELKTEAHAKKLDELRFSLCEAYEPPIERTP